ncbi:SWIM zinc finger family protein [Streptomyces sp. NPDC001137]|uniref:SWIM zinc finger family protein n=1 Tax=Streptomyces sp. NPDC001137 TaxID=3154378 RepID=UPI00331FC5FC
MTPGPADEARRALRQARGSAAEEPAGAVRREPPGAGVAQQPDAEEPQASTQGPEGPGDAAARPGDAARAALRRAVSARRGGGVGVGDPHTDAMPSVPGPDDGSDSAASPTSGSDRDAAEDTHDSGEGPVGPPAVPDTSATRPADVAREALRAARAESRQARTVAERTEAEAGRRSRRPAPPSDRTRGDAPRRAAGVRARDLRDLLADSFRMPGSANEPETVLDDNEATKKGSSGPRAATPESDPEAAVQTDTRMDQPRADRPPTGTAPSTPTPASLPPHSMAAPSRDGELRRTFPAFRSRTSRSPADASFAETWWGNAWVTALEEGALDAKRLARGRSYAEQGHVDAITVTPGLVLAYVQGSRPRPYRVQVRLRTLEDADWARFLDAAAERPGHIAALLDKELPQGLADCGVPLLPGPRDLDPHCSCPDRGHPCKHAAALCYQTARLLDADPFVLLLLRGRGERELLDALSRLSATRAARAAQEQEPAPLPGVRATEALTPRRLPPLPAPLPVPPHPEQPPVYPAAPGGPDPFALDQLATDAAARAHALLSTGRDPVAELTLWQDAVRLAAARPGSGLTAGTRALYASLASAAGRTPAELARAVAAWRQGGLEGLAVLDEPWDPPAGRFDRARPLLLAADLPAFRPWRNHLTHPRGHVQLRLGRDGLWYAYESEPGHDDWWPRGTPDLDPVGALTGLGTPNDL